MVMCFAPDCKHYSEKHGCRFFVFPKDTHEKKKWILLLRRKDREPSMHSLVCSCHFKDGDRKNGPTIFEHNISKRFEDQPSTSGTKPKKLKKQLHEVVGTEDKQNVEDNSEAQAIEALPEAEMMLEIPAEEGSTTPKVTFNVSASTEAENYFLRKELLEATEKLKKLSVSFSFEHIKNSDSRINAYTGLPSCEIFMCLYGLMEDISLKYYHGWTVTVISKIDQLLLTLMKLKLNLLNEDLAVRFNICSKTVANIFFTWLYALHEVLFKKFMDKIPSRNKNKLCMPTCFNNFTNCRIILDCTEIYCIQPKNMEKQRATYSSYKHRNTLKVLVGVAPNGVITYASELYPGSVSDKKIVRHCGILDQLEAGDLIIADKGFLIKDMLPQGVHLNIPPFLSTPQFTPEQVIQTRTIARARIHIERAIRRIKHYRILSLIPASLISHSTEIFQTCVALTNLHCPLIREVEDLYKEKDL
ncbi:unnamed protein product [Callosobruchus maculatus]|uniref:THAP-type domain-containing protein n=1 Tax=Callosobruchus maculatus TaxID=64391 RepID=A0A653BJT0_CALMS|nr:unnamed protein product [Callosobruchus maculatus]